MLGMIKGWKSEDARAFFQTGQAPRKAGWAQAKSAARRKLDMLDAAEKLEDLRSPPGNRLEALKGDRVGQHAIRINNQWRICFVWKDGEAHDVEITDDH